MSDINVGTYCKYTKLEDRSSILEASLHCHIEVVNYLHEVV